MVYDTEPLEDAVGRLPYSVEEGVAHTVAWMKATRRHRPPACLIDRCGEESMWSITTSQDLRK